MIDSANLAIQLPQYVYENLLATMQFESMTEDFSVTEERTDQGAREPRILNRNCDEVWAKLKPIEFKLENTTIVIQPRGYTYQLDKGQHYCQIGIHSLQGVKSEYRLGTIFLRNFYTSLDYDKDLIAIGVNRGSAALAKATIEGHKENPYNTPPPRRSVAGLFILILFIALVCVAVAWFILQRRSTKNKKKAAEAAAAKKAENEGEVSEDSKEEADEDDGENDAGDGEEGDEMVKKDKEKKSKKSNYLIQSEEADETVDHNDEEDNNEEEEVLTPVKADGE